VKALRFFIITLLLAAIVCSAAAAKPDWEAIRQEQAWYYAADGSVVSGFLNTIVKAWLKGEGKTDPEAKLTIYLCKDKTLTIKEISRLNASRLTFKVDKTALPKAKKKTVQVSEKKPGTGNPGISAGNENKKITLYVWLEEPEETETVDSPGDAEDVLEPASADSEADSTPLTESSSGGHPSGGSSIGGGGRVTSHAREKHQSEIGYDQVGIWALAQGGNDAMSTLMISGEEQSLSMTHNGQPAEFIPVLISRQSSAAADGTPALADTLLLQALQNSSEASIQWSFSGDLLRKLLRSGISYLALKAGEQVTLLPTEGFLSGIKYDELKMRGTAGSLFNYTITMAPAQDARISVSVGGETLEVTADSENPMFWKDILFLSASELTLPDFSALENG
jgi:hypothetical protein